MPEEDTFVCECGTEVRASDRFCHHCGSSFSKNTCECGADIPDNANYCPGCGIKIEASEEPVEEPIPEEPVEPDLENQQQEFNNNWDDKPKEDSFSDSLGLTNINPY